MARIVVREDRPLRRILVLLLVAGVAAGATAAWFGPRQLTALADKLELEARVAELESEAGRSQAEFEELRRVIAVHERERQVEEAAYSRVEGDLARLQTQKLALEEEVAFYRGIVASSENQGLKVRRLFVFPGDEAGGYRFHVVLTRNMNDDKVLAGSISLSIDGLRGGEPVSIPATTLLARSDGKVDFRFRYFHRLEGDFDLPPEFEPRRVMVRVEAPGESPASAERTFDWELTTG